MSFVGISPTDVVRAAGAGHKAVTALKGGEHGAQQQYRQSKRALAYRIRALEDLVTATADVLPDVEDQYGPLMETDKTFQQSLSSYEQSLGHGAAGGRRYGVVDKLKYAFDGEKDVQAHFDYSRPAVDAVVFRTMQAQIEILKKYHAQDFARFDGFDEFVSGLNARLREIHAASASSDLAAKIDDLHQDLCESLIPFRFATTTVKHLDSQPSTRIKPRNVPRGKPGYRPSRRAARRCSKAGSVESRGHSDPVEQEVSITGDPEQTEVTAQKPATVRRLGDWNKKCPWFSSSTRNEDDEAARFVSNVLTATFAISLSVTYQHSSTQRLLVSLLQASRKDPFLATLLACVITALARCLSQVPRQIQLLADDSIGLETALGENLKIPSCYWKVHEIFHGYLEAHFNERPGHALVARKSYRILLGGLEGQIIDATKWTQVIAKRMHLTMAMVLDGSTITCPKCGGALQLRRANTSSYCHPCQSLYTFTAETSPGRGLEQPASSAPRPAPDVTQIKRGNRSADAESGSTIDGLKNELRDTLSFANIMLRTPPNQDSSSNPSSLSMTTSVFAESWNPRLVNLRAHLDAGNFEGFRCPLDTGSDLNIISVDVLKRMGIMKI